MISSPEINKLLQKSLSPVLRENGFASVQARKAWGWHDPCIWVLEIRAVGNYFSQCTGWPPMSVGVSLGVYYDFIPKEGPPLSVDAQGRLCPHEYECHARSHLERNLNQDVYQSKLFTSPERKRRDIWWIAPNGENVVEVVDDITRTFSTQGQRWFVDHIDLHKAFSEIERGHDCLIKYSQAAHFARHLGKEAKYQEYLKKLDQEKQRISKL